MEPDRADYCYHLTIIPLTPTPVMSLSIKSRKMDQTQKNYLQRWEKLKDCTSFHSVPSLRKGAADRNKRKKG